MEPSTPPFLLLSSPYRTLTPLSSQDSLPPKREGRRGAALVWCLSTPPASAEFDFARDRPPGVALIVVLPPADAIDRPEHVLRVTEFCRPHSILPHHRPSSIIDLKSVLSRPPDDLPGEVTDFLTWRGLAIDLETRRLIRKTFELSGELTTVKGLARALYLSRRALGRRFTTRGLPVPSHWLHFGRVLRSALRLQDTQGTLFSAATNLGYPDAFALSNQMARLVGIRPTVARDHLGWEWILEEWLLREARTGGFSRDLASTLLATDSNAPGGTGSSASSPADPPSTRGVTRRTEPKGRIRDPQGSSDEGRGTG